MSYLLLARSIGIKHTSWIHHPGIILGKLWKVYSLTNLYGRTPLIGDHVKRQTLLQPNTQNCKSSLNGDIQDSISSS